MQVNDAANYTASLNFNLTSDFLLNWILKNGAESGQNYDNSGIYVILSFTINDSITASVIESEREEKIDSLELKRYKYLTEIQLLNRETAKKIQELRAKAESSPRKWLYLNNIKKIQENLEPKKEVLRAKIEKVRQKIDKWEAFYHKKLANVVLLNELSTSIMRLRKGKIDKIESFFEKI